MGVSAIQEQRDIIINAIKKITRGDWKVLILDEESKKIVDNVVKEDDILNENIANIERIEERRPVNPDMDAIYLLSPQPHIVDCLLADFEKRRYRKSFLVWTALLDTQLRRRIDSAPSAKQQLSGFETLSVDYFPRESHLITFRDPWSFPILYHPACNDMVVPHMQTLAQKITGICVTLGEYPKVRYYKPRKPFHEASVLCSILAKFVQEELDGYAQRNPDFPPQSSRPQGILIITDRCMDLVAPLVHEFTYQAMAHDLLPIKDGDKVLYEAILNEGTAQEEKKEMEIGESDEIWVKNRHTHMKDTIDRLMGDFQKFIDENPHFMNQSGDATSLNAIKDMLAGLPQFQTLKEAYSLHLSMAQDCMNKFQQRKLPDVASIEQCLATGLDEDYRKPKNVADQIIRLLDDENIGPPERLRLIILYVLYKDGLVPEDIGRLLQHSSLPLHEKATIDNLDLLGAHSAKPLKDTRTPPLPVFPRKAAPTAAAEEYSLSRFEPALKLLLEESSKGSLDPQLFPYTKPPLDQNGADLGAVSNSSLRSAKPTWAQNRRSLHESKQRVIVFMAGGATYSEARECYEISKKSSRDVFLATSHMLTPALFIKQIGDLSVERRQLHLPSDRTPKKAPAHLFEREAPKVPAALSPGSSQGSPPSRASPRPPAPYQPPTAALGAMSINNSTQSHTRKPSDNMQMASTLQQAEPSKGKLEKKNKDSVEEKKKRGFFGSKK